jgi:hyperosmotically inducible periplasmic protein
MKSASLLALLLCAATMAGCAGMSGQSGPGSGAAQQTGAATGDVAIVSRIKSTLVADADLKDTKIDVSSEQGVVRLKGEIKSLALRKKVDAIVRDIPGVKSVDNRLIVTG